MSKHAIVLHKFEGVDVDNTNRLCLIVEQGSEVEVLAQREKDWWLVGDGEKVGYVPITCLSAVIEDTAGYGYQLRKPRKPKKVLTEDPPELDYENLQSLIDQEDGEWSEDPEYVNLDEIEIKPEGDEDLSIDSTSTANSEINLTLEDDELIFKMDTDSGEEEMRKRPTRVKFSETLFVREMIPRDDGYEADREGEDLTDDKKDGEVAGAADGQFKFEDYETPLIEEEEMLQDVKRERYYGYHLDLKFSEGYFKYYFGRCEKDTCLLWKHENHEKCYDGERVPHQDESIVPAFITKLFSPTDEPEEKPRRNIFLDLFTPPDM